MSHLESSRAVGSSNSLAAKWLQPLPTDQKPARSRPVLAGAMPVSRPVLSNCPGLSDAGQFNDKWVSDAGGDCAPPQAAGPAQHASATTSAWRQELPLRA